MVNLLILRLEKSVFISACKFAYFVALYCFDFSRFVSWHIVSSNVSTLFCPSIAMSGLRELNRLDSWLYWGSFKSANIFKEGLLPRIIASTSILRTSSCLRLYRSRATGEPQFEITCLFVCEQVLQRGQRGSVAFLHRNKFAAVGNCCINAFLAKLNSGPASLSISFAHLVIADLFKCSFIAAMILPWDSSEIMWLKLDLECSSLSS